MSENNTNWEQSVAGVLIKNEKVLLARHTYGKGKDMLIIPGGYVMNGESPQEALKREFLEEVSINVEPKEIIGIRFNSHDWYIVFRADYISGEAKSDNNENNEVLWLDISKALSREDVPELTKSLINCAVNGKGLEQLSYSSQNHLPNSFYGIT